MMCVNMLRNTSYYVYGFKAHEHVNAFVNLLDLSVIDKLSLLVIFHHVSCTFLCT